MKRLLLICLALLALGAAGCGEATHTATTTKHPAPSQTWTGPHAAEEKAEWDKAGREVQAERAKQHQEYGQQKERERQEAEEAPEREKANRQIVERLRREQQEEGEP